MKSYILNPTCSKPKLFGKALKDRWYVYFTYYQGDKRKMFKFYEGLNMETLFDRQKEAEILLLKYHELLTNRKFDVVKATFVGSLIETTPIEEVTKQFLLVKKQEVSKRSYIFYEYVLNHFANFAKGYLVNQINEDIITAFFKHKKYLTNTKRNAKTIIKMLFRHIIYDYKAKIENPVNYVRIGKTVKTDLHSILTEPEFVACKSEIAKLNDNAFELAVNLIYYTFARPVEITRIKIGDLDLDRNCISIRKANAKNRISRFLIIDKELKDFLIGLNFDFKNPEIADNYLIGTNGGYKLDIGGKMPILPKRLNCRYRQIQKKLNLSKDKSLYAFKHLGNVHLSLKRQVPLIELQIRNGHRSPDMTLIYLREIMTKAPELLVIK